MGKDSAKSAGKDAEKDAADVKDLKELTKAFENFKRDFRSEIREIKDSIAFCSDTCSEVKDVATDIKNMRAEMQELIRQNMELKAENKRLSQKCDELEQYQRLNNLEIKGAPVGNDPVDVVRKISEAVGTAVDLSDIDACHWIPTPKPGVKKIIVRFVKRTKRDDILAKCRKKRLDSSMLGDDKKTPIFVNEHLTQKGKALLAAAIQKKKEAAWKFVWTSGGKILARKDEGPQAIHIADETSLAKIRN